MAQEFSNSSFQMVGCAEQAKDTPLLQLDNCCNIQENSLFGEHFKLYGIEIVEEPERVFSNECDMTFMETSLTNTGRRQPLPVAALRCSKTV
jgi:hypothetical protein